jgi:hypothetical protein
VARIATTTLSSITCIGEVVVVSLGAKGLRLHKGSRARKFGGKSIAAAFEERTKSAKNYALKNPGNTQAKNQRIYAWDKPL